MVIDEIFCDACGKRAEFYVEEIKQISSVIHLKDGSIEFSDSSEELLNSKSYCRECFFNNEM
jgi:hypothetical protein